MVAITAKKINNRITKFTMEHTAKRTVLVDMDGVIADFEEPNNNIIRNNFPDIVPEFDRLDFYFSDTYKDRKDVVQVIEDEVRKPGFIKRFPVVQGAIHGWGRILEAGFSPRICSSPLENHETVIVEKIDWLEEHFVPVFGSWVVDTAIFNRDKSGYLAIAIIDDRPTLRNIESATWQHILFDRSYNRSIKTDYRLKGWGDTNLLNLLNKAKENYRED